MKKPLRTIKNYICYCGIEKDEFKAVKLDAYASNFQIWRILHIVMDVAFALLFVFACISDLARDNLYFYLGGFIYSAIVNLLFFFVLFVPASVMLLVDTLLFYLRSKQLMNYLKNEDTIVKNAEEKMQEIRAKYQNN